MVKAVQQAHAKFEERKRQQKEEQRKEEELKKKQLVDIQKQKEMIEKAEKRKCNLDQKEQQLIEDEKELDGEFSIAQRLLEGAKLDLGEAIDKDDMIGVKVAREMIQSTSTKLAKISQHKDEQQKIRTDIGSKRKSAFEKLMQSYKKKNKQEQKFRHRV